MKKLIVILMAIGVLGGAGYFVYGKSKKAERYREVRPERGPIAVEFRQTGTVSPRNRLEIKPPVSGRIEDILVREGQRVTKGEIIAWMSSTDRAALLDAVRSKGPEEVRKWENTYKPAPIIAPLSGFVIARSREPGQTVTLNDVITVMADQLIIEAKIDETDLRHVRVGQDVSIFLDAYPERTFTGTVEHIAYESELVNNVTVYKVKIRPDRVPPAFRAGMTATVKVTAEKRDDALLLPVEAVIDRGGRKLVLVKTGGSDPERRKIETGITNGKSFEVVSGLNGDETILITAKERTGGGNRQGGRVPGMPGMGRR